MILHPNASFTVGNIISFSDDEPQPEKKSGSDFYKYSELSSFFAISIECFLLRKKGKASYFFITEVVGSK